jgi:hypothetical protein
MSIPATCPSCGSQFTLNDSLEGERVRCRHCQCPFLVRASGARGEGPRRRDEDEHLDDPPSEGPRGISPVVWVLSGVGVALVLLFAACGGLFYYTMQQAGNTAEQLAKNIQQNLPAPGPRDLDDALRQLRSPDRGQRQGAALWLVFQPVNAARRAEVALALEPLLADPDPGTALAGTRALEVWGGPENVAALVRLMESDLAGLEGDECRSRAVDTLVRLQDARGGAAIARQWKRPAERARTRRALEKLGTAAEPAVLPYLKDADHDIQAEACRTLQVIGTRRSLVDLQALLDSTREKPELKSLHDRARDALDAIKARL